MYRLQQGKPRSVLEGVPFCVKDCIHALPFPSTAGCTWVRLLITICTGLSYVTDSTSSDWRASDVWSAW